MEDTIDLLQIKIEKAKAQLPKETLAAINAVDWKAVILGMRAKKVYSIEQLGDLELETELLLAGLTSPENYAKELEERMHITRAAANELVRDMNTLAFSKIKEELIRNTERKKADAGEEKIESREEMIKKIENPEPPKDIHPMLVQKLSTPVQTKPVTTEHSLENITKTAAPTSYPPKGDPYRVNPD